MRRRTLEIVRETRAVVTELMIMTWTREWTDLRMLQGSVLAAAEQVMRRLDLEHGERRTKAWLTRRATPRIPQAWQEVRSRQR